jgi:hypothetical protein
MTDKQSPNPDKNHDPSKFSGIRMENDDDRSEEFKDSRNLFVSDVNSWLKELAEARDAGEPISALTHRGVFPLAFTGSARRTVTDFGPTAHGLRAVTEETVPGMWLGGDGQTLPYHLQASIPRGEQGVQTFLDVKGTDPTAMAVYGDSFSPSRNSEVVAEVTVEYHDETGQEQTRQYSVNGSGAVNIATRGVDGVTRAAYVRDEADVVSARQVFQAEVIAVLGAQ